MRGSDLFRSCFSYPRNPPELLKAFDTWMEGVHIWVSQEQLTIMLLFSQAFMGSFRCSLVLWLGFISSSGGKEKLQNVAFCCGTVSFSCTFPVHQVFSPTVKSIKLAWLLCGPEKKGSFHCVISLSARPCQANFFQDCCSGNWKVWQVPSPKKKLETLWFGPLLITLIIEFAYDVYIYIYDKSSRIPNVH